MGGMEQERVKYDDPPPLSGGAIDLSEVVVRNSETMSTTEQDDDIPYGWAWLDAQ